MKISRQLLLMALLNGAALLVALALTASHLADLRHAFADYEQDQTVLYQFTEIKAAALAASRADLLDNATPKTLTDTDQLIRDRWQTLSSQLPAASRDQAAKAVLGNWADFHKNFANAIAIFAKSPQDAISIPERIYPMYIQPLAQATDALIAQRQQTAIQHRDAIRSRIDNLLWVTLLPLLLAGIVVITLQVRFGQRIRKRVAQMSSVSAQLAAGDLSHRLPAHGGDEISDLATHFNHFIGSFENILREVKSAADNVHDHTRQVAHQSRELGQRSIDQASQLDETQRTIAHISDAVHEIASSVSRASESSGSVRSMSHNAIHITSQTAQRIEDMCAAVETAMTQLSLLTHSVGQIADVSALIKEIAKQTNLLALNAAIEAARAGEAGRGFSVVADEVRALSERTAASTVQIEGLLHEVETAVTEVTTAIATAQDHANATHEHGQRMANNIGEIAPAISNVDGMLDGIAVATEQNSVATRNVCSLIADATEVSQQVKTQLEAASHTLSALQNVAARLRQTTLQFTVSGQSLPA